MSTEPAPFTMPVMIAELQRELAMRNKVYPKHVALLKITVNQARERIAIIEAVIEVLKGLQ